MNFVSSFLRNQNSMVVFHRNHDNSRTSATQQPIRIFKSSTHIRGACLCIYNSTDRFDPPLQRVYTTIGKFQRYSRKFLQKILSTVLCHQFQNLPLGHRKVNIHLGIIRNSGKRSGRRRRHQTPHTERNLSHYSIERTDNSRIGIVITGIYQLGFRLSQLGLSRSIRVFGHLQIIFADDISSLQLPFVFCRKASGFGTGFRYLYISLGDFQCSFVRDCIDNEKNLTFFYDRPLIDSQICNKATNIRTYLNIPLTLNCSRVIAIPLHRIGL